MAHVVGIRLFFGKTKVMAKALGTSPEDEYQPNLNELAKVWISTLKRRERRRGGIPVFIGLRYLTSIMRSLRSITPEISHNAALTHFGAVPIRQRRPPLYLSFSVRRHRLLLALRPQRLRTSRHLLSSPIRHPSGHRLRESRRDPRRRRRSLGSFARTDFTCIGRVDKIGQGKSGPRSGTSRL